MWARILPLINDLLGSKRQARILFQITSTSKQGSKNNLIDTNFKNSSVVLTQTARRFPSSSETEGADRWGGKPYPLPIPHPPLEAFYRESNHIAPT